MKLLQDHHELDVFMWKDIPDKKTYKDATSALDENKTTWSTGDQAVVLRTCGAEPGFPPAALGLKAEMTSNEHRHFT